MDKTPHNDPDIKVQISVDWSMRYASEKGEPWLQRNMSTETKGCSTDRPAANTAAKPWPPTTESRTERTCICSGASAGSIRRATTEQGPTAVRCWPGRDRMGCRTWSGGVDGSAAGSRRTVVEAAEDKRRKGRKKRKKKAGLGRHGKGVGAIDVRGLSSRRTPPRRRRE